MRCRTCRSEVSRRRGQRCLSRGGLADAYTLVQLRQAGQWKPLLFARRRGWCPSVAALQLSRRAMPHGRCCPRAPALASAASCPSCWTSTPAGAGRRRRSDLDCPAMTTASATGRSSCALCLKFGWNDLRGTELRQGIWARSMERRKRPGPAPSALLPPALLEQLRAWWCVAGQAWGPGSSSWRAPRGSTFQDTRPGTPIGPCLQGLGGSISGALAATRGGGHVPARRSVGRVPPSGRAQRREPGRSTACAAPVGFFASHFVRQVDPTRLLPRK